MTSPEEEKPEDNESSTPDVQDAESGVVETDAESSESEDSENNEIAEEAEENESPQTEAESDAAIETEEADKDGVVVYDFAHPSHKLNSRLPVLEVINEKIAKGMSAYLSSQFHQSIDVTPLEPSFEKLEQYANSVPVSVSINQYRLEPLNGNSMVILDGDLIFMLVDSFFGGVDTISETLGARIFTPTELRIAERVRDNIVRAMKVAWEPILRIDPKFITSISRTEYASPAHPSTVVVCSKFEIELKAGKGECHIVIPYSVLEPVRPQLTNDLQKVCDQNREWQREFTEQVLGCETDIQGVFAESRISVRQLIELKVGDFIPLGKVQTVEFSSEGIPLFEAAVGVSSGMVSASVTRWHTRNSMKKGTRK